MLLARKNLTENLKPINVVIEGNIGAGKSTLIESLSKNDLIEVFPEPLEQWQNLNGCNLFELFYKDAQRYTIPFQFYAILTILKSQLSKTNRPIRLFERSIDSSKDCFTKAMHMNGTIEKPMFDVLSAWYTFIDEHFPSKPDLIIYLATTPQQLYSRIQQRGRSEERVISLDYLKLLHNLHEDYIDKQRLHTPIFTLNADVSMCDINNQYDRCASRIMQLLFQTPLL